MQGHPDPKDESDLGTLSLLTKIYGGLCAFGGVLMVALLAVMAFLIPAERAASGRAGGGEGAEVTILYLIIAVIGAVISGAMAFLYFKSADCIKKRQCKTLIYVAAALACTNAPLGLALGIYTFVLLERPSIKGLFS